MRFHIRRFLAGIVMVLIALLIQACSGDKHDSCNFVLNAYSERVSWGSEEPIVLYVHNSFPRSLLPALEKAVGTWERSLGKKLFELGGYVGGESRPRKDSYSTIYYLDSWSQVDVGKQAVTAIYWLGDKIEEADMRINGRDYQYSDVSSGNLGAVDFQSLMIHELGHVLGLTHNNDLIGSVMNQQLQKGQVRRNLAPGDLASLRCEY